MIEFQPSQVVRTITLDGVLNRPVTLLAVLTIIAALAGLGAFVHPVACVASVCSLSFGVFAFRQVRRYEYSRSSRLLIAGGMSIASVTLVSAPAWHLMMYRSEASSGYQRVSFDELYTRTAKSDAFYAPSDAAPTKLIPDEDATRLDGQSICLKGYVYPTGQFNGMTEFLLTANGGYDGAYVGVILAKGTVWDWYKDGVAVSGVLELNPNYTPGSNLEVRYILKNASVRPARTLYGMESRSRDGGC